MHDVRQEFLDIIAQVRTHLEFQRALGVRTIEIPSRQTSSASEPAIASAPVPETAPPKQERAALKQGGLPEIEQELRNCTRCGLHKGRRTVVFGEGNPKAKIVFVGEWPGREEDNEGKPFMGAEGQLLTDIIVKGMKLKREDVYLCTIVKCLPDRRPGPDEIEACEAIFRKEIEAIQPQVIVALGEVSAQTLLKTREGIATLRGSWKTYQGIPLMATLHPSRLLKNPEEKALVWADIRQVMAKAGIRRQ